MSRRVVEEAKTRFNAFVNGDDKALHPTVRGSVYAIVLKYGGKAEYDQVYNIYKTSKVTDQKMAALGALGHTRVPELIDHTLSLTVNADEVKPQDVIYPMGAVCANPLGRLKAWAFVQKNFKIFYDRYYKSSPSILMRIISHSTSGLGTSKRAEEVTKFFDGHEVSAVNRTIKQSLEKIKIVEKWVTRDASDVEKWLSSRK